MTGRSMHMSTGFARSVLGLLLTVCILCGVAACSSEPKDGGKTGHDEQRQTSAVPRPPEFRSLLVQEASDMLKSEHNVLVVDVRSPEEGAVLRIPGSVEVPLEEIVEGRSQLPKNQPVLLVCDVGGRSYMAGLYLVKQKYPWVYNLRGGIAAWEKAGLPLERGEKAKSQ